MRKCSGICPYWYRNWPKDGLVWISFELCLAFQSMNQVGRKLFNLLFLISKIFINFPSSTNFYSFGSILSSRADSLVSYFIDQKVPLWVPSCRLEMPTMCPESRLSHDIIKMDQEDRNQMLICDPGFLSLQPEEHTIITTTLPLPKPLFSLAILERKKRIFQGLFYLKKIRNLTKS